MEPTITNNIIKKWNRRIFNINKESYEPINIYNFDNTLNKKNDCHDIKQTDFIHDLRRASECHKMIREFVQNNIKPNMKIYDICNMVENKIIELTKCNNLSAGIAFPTGVSLNNVLAHDTANPNDTRIFGKNDICKLDYGIHFNGRIVDCAFSMIFDSKYDNLLAATKDAVWSAIKLCGPDALCNDISKNIKEVIESYEIELNGKTYTIKAVNDLGGHTIDKYNIHSGKLILSGPSKHPFYSNMRMQPNEQWALEFFASTGNGTYKQGEIINHYMLNRDAPRINYNFKTTGDIHRWITKNRSTLPFTQRWMTSDQKIGSKYKLGLKELVDKKVLTAYPPLYDINNSFSSHMEHTIYIHENGKEVLTEGEDY